MCYRPSDEGHDYLCILLVGELKFNGLEMRDLERVSIEIVVKETIIQEGKFQNYCLELVPN